MTKVLVAEGDSWFALSEYKPWYIRILIGIKRTDVINELKNFNYDIESVADTSHTIESMAYSKDQFDQFKKEIKKSSEPPSAILLSGGGNDITGKVLEMMLNHKNSDSYSSNPLNEKVVKGVIDGRLQEAYLKLLNKIDGLCQTQFNNASSNIPVLVHGYAYSIPNGKNINIVRRRAFRRGSGPRRKEVRIKGPWLQPAFEERGYFCLEEMTCIMQELTNRFNCMLKKLCETERFSNIYVRHVDLRKCWETKLEDDDYEKYWDDELHPSKKGFKLIAQKFDKLIAQKFDKVIKQTIEDQDNQNA